MLTVQRRRTNRERNRERGTWNHERRFAEFMTDPIADMLARIRNATQSRHPKVEMPLSRLKVEIAKILELEGYVQGFQVVEPKAGEPQGTLRVFLKYGPRGERVITGLE